MRDSVCVLYTGDFEKVEPKGSGYSQADMFVYKLKWSAETGEVYRVEARLIARDIQMKMGVDFDDSFSPTPGLAVGRFMLSLAVPK